MKKLTVFLCLALTFAYSAYGQSGVRIVGAQQFQVDDNNPAHAKDYLTSVNGSLGIDQSGIPTAGVFPSPCALLDLSSTTQGFLAPRMTTLQEAAICGGAPTEGLIVYNTTTHTLDVWNGTTFAGQWQTKGNANLTVDNTDNLLGSTAASTVKPFNLIVGGTRIMRYQTSNNIVGGAAANAINGTTTNSVISGGGTNTINTNSSNSTIAGGTTNTINGNTSTIGGGNNNTVSASAFQATIAGGSANTVSGAGSTIAGGFNNSVTGAIGFVGAGQANVIGNQGFSVIGGGSANTNNGGSAVIGGGQTNNINVSFFSTIGGGLSNVVTNDYGTVGGGASNSADFVSTVGGGSNNHATIQYSTVGGGLGNTASNLGTVGGGEDNQITAGDHGTIAGGRNHRLSGVNATIGGGAGSTASGSNSVVAGGVNNQASGASSTVGGGYLNWAANTYSTVAGGTSNTANGVASTIGGGAVNLASGNNATVVGGTFNSATGDNSTTMGANAASNSFGQLSHGNTIFAVSGDAQKAEYILHGTTSDANPHEIFLDGASAEIGTLFTNESMALRITVVAQDVTNTANVATFEFQTVMYRRVGVTQTIQCPGGLSINPTGGVGATGTWSVGVTFAGGGSGPALVVIGAAGETIRWVARVEAVQVGF